MRYCATLDRQPHTGELSVCREDEEQKKKRSHGVSDSSGNKTAVTVVVRTCAYNRVFNSINSININSSIYLLLTYS